MQKSRQILADSYGRVPLPKMKVNTMVFLAMTLSHPLTELHFTL